MPVTQSELIVHSPRIIVVNDLESSLPLEHTLVTAQITGPVVSVAVVQRFGNPVRQPVEVDYLFPLPEEAAITGFDFQVGSRHIEGDLQERQAAQSAYEDARDQGKRAGLFEQRRPNLFAIRLANIQPGETIFATVRYQQRLKFSDGGYEFIFPMGLTPKYDRPQHPEEGHGAHSPIAKAGETIGAVEIQLAVDAGLPVRDPISPSHSLQIVRIDEQRIQVNLAGEHIPDRDFVLRYSLANEDVAPTGWTSGEPGQEYFLATIVPPRLSGDSQANPREFVFVLDRSGSMTGEPIAQARNALRACLRALNPSDTFRILLFDNALEWMDREALPITQAQIERADAYLNSVQGRGGTEILLAIEAALSLPVDARRTRFVVFLTDGAVSAEGQALDQVRAKIGSARLFTFGIGPSVNRALLNRMARLGRGKAAFLQLDEDIEGAIIRFQDSVSFPVMSDVSLHWKGAKTWDVYPTRLPDMYYDEPLELCGRMARDTHEPVQLSIHAQRDGQPVQIDMLLDPARHEPVVERLWAQARVEDLIEQQSLQPGSAQKLRDEILGFALRYRLVTQYTSFVAIDRQLIPGGGEKPTVIHVAQPLPQGLQIEGFMGGHPLRALGMAMPASAAMPPSPKQASMHLFRAASDRIAGKMNESMQSFSRPMDSSKKLTGVESAPAVTETSGLDIGLRWLARNQKLDGSWNSDVEQTSAALLAFIRAGHTTRTGIFRQALRRAVRWLVDHPGEQFAGFVRALALKELALATGDLQDQNQARHALEELSHPTSLLERAAVGEDIAPPDAIHTLDELRLAGLLNVKLPAPAELTSTDQSGLVSVWSAVLAGR